jgi:glycerol-3-phosphate O-acyltransferase
MLARVDDAGIARAAAANVASRWLERAPDLGALEEAIATSLYHEDRRLEQAGNADRDRADRSFYAGVAAELRQAHGRSREQLLLAMVERYAREIEGHFDGRVYAFATRALPVLLTAMLHGIAPWRMLSRLGHLGNIDDLIVLAGEVERLRQLAGRGTIVLAPSHCSNLDSLVVGYSIYRMGLPPFSYGAGLNLFSNPVEAFFMHHLGAYTIDRQKTDPLYREVLKEYAAVSLERGQHNLFFPGGTRSRSGALETRLKKGLLGASICAFRRALEAGRPEARFYVVPCTLTYPLVLEAETLIDDYLRTAREASMILPGDEYGLVQRWVSFLGGLMALDVQVQVVIGAPLDPMGDDVDEHGVSLDPRGRPLDPRRYLIADGALVADPERDAAYTSALAERIVQRYRRDNVVVPTSVVAFAAFEQLRARDGHGDLHRMLREASVSRVTIPYANLIATTDRVIGEVRSIAARGEIRLAPAVQTGCAESVLDRALRLFSTYHRVAVLSRDAGGISVRDSKLLFYYRNRLDGYGLLGAPELGVRP